MVDENSIEYKYGAECFKVVRFEREVAALKAELAQQTHNSAIVPCPFRNDTVGCPLSGELWICGDKPCLIQRARAPVAQTLCETSVDLFY
jgi:hypothetical protein